MHGGAGLQAGRSVAGGANFVFIPLDGAGAGLKARRRTAGGATMNGIVVAMLMK